MPTIDKIAALDFVLFVELIGRTSPGHDQSTPLVDADMHPPGQRPLGLTRFSGASTTLGILDTGFMMGGGARHAQRSEQVRLRPELHDRRRSAPSTTRTGTARTS